jgi:hypothetical protein
MKTKDKNTKCADVGQMELYYENMKTIEHNYVCKIMPKINVEHIKSNVNKIISIYTLLGLKIHG